MSYDLMNDMIDYIESNLTENIEYKKLARIVGVSEYSLKRIFLFLTGVSLSEYIRKRRLSKAYEELKMTNIKVIDLAMKYNYDSAISFARSFKSLFGVTPTECRKSDMKYKQFSVITLRKNGNTEHEINYEIKKFNKKIIYCFEAHEKNHDDLLFRIRELYKRLRDNGIRDIFDENGMYGISICDDENDEYYYYVGSEVKLPCTKKIEIEQGTYAVFEVGVIDQKEITKVYDYIYNRFIKSTDYIILNKPEIELYTKDNCYLYIPIKDKQN